jgi:hypothetical protein
LLFLTPIGGFLMLLFPSLEARLKQFLI